jgi:hypothetical protein
MRASLIPRSQLLRAARSSALVRRRAGIMSPRFAVAEGVHVGNLSVPVGTANAGKNRFPTGFVVYVWPVGDVQITLPSASWRRGRRGRWRSVVW